MTRTCRLTPVLASLVFLAVTVQPTMGQQRVAPSETAWRILDPAPGFAVAADGRQGTPVLVRFDLLAGAARDGGIIELPLTNGVTVRAQVAWQGTDPSQIFLAGPLVDGQEGEVSITAVGDTLVARIVVGGRLFMIRRAPDSPMHVVSEIDQQTFPEEMAPRAPPVRPPPVPGAQLDPPGATDALGDTNQFVDLLVVYSPAARAYMGSTASIVAELTGAVNNANLALANANVVHRFRLANSIEIAYTEAPAGQSSDLDRLTDRADGFLDSVHALRDASGADAVTLLVRSPALCGVGWLMTPWHINSGFASYAFNVVDISCANANLAMAHEIGHNMGLVHDRANSGTSQPAFPYGYGYRVDGVGRDVMAYACPSGSCSRRTIFSTPRRNFPLTTTPAGTATEDNARALDGTSLVVANFRQSVGCTYTLSATTFTIGLAGGIGTVGVTTATGCTWTAVSNTSTFLTVTAGASGSGNGLVTYAVTANSSGLRTGTMTIAGQTFTLSQGPTMTTDRTTVSFGAIKAGGVLSGVTSSSQVVRLTFTGASPTWIASADPASPWLRITGGAGTGNGQFTVGVANHESLPATGTVTGQVIVYSGGAANSPRVIAIRLALFASSLTSASPFGAFDTPAGAASVAGSIATTGWALDDVEVVRVEIWRDRAPGETTPVYGGAGPGHGKIYIADPVFVTGARPDIEALYGTLPLANRGGWGYLLLTYGLYNQGNGPFTLYAFAYDREGRSATLGSKTITVSNSTATKPFGSIDTPAYGQTMTTSFWNFGWALTPTATPTCTITNGNVYMSIDSGPLTPVSYGDTRPDIAAAFPGFSNGAGAGGAYHINLATLATGTHQIGWYVVDNCNRAEGIGSRFFNVLQGSAALPEASAVVTAPRPATNVVGDSAAPIDVRRGLDTTVVTPNPAGTRVVAIAQSERVEVQLPPSAEPYAGYQVVSGERRDLPLGSSLDAAQGLFYWQPAAGFLGAQDLEFVSASGVPIRVRAVVGTSVQAVIDTPQPGTVSSSFMIAGWALDEAATTGTGIDTVHVWAYPTAGGDPIFLGVADYGDARADIGVAFGAQFERAAYGLSVDGLAPGTYDVVVYPHSAVTGDFHGAQVVRVTVP